MYLLTILILLFTVTIHEMGHLVVGILSKVNVKEVSIGIGPKITS
ncbi:MAG: site-2 protease family protein [Mycoplasmoidaceae bacterium]|nr:site-2 protease family protein [Mycoplasmoidaceae bacterium]